MGFWSFGLATSLAVSKVLARAGAVRVVLFSALCSGPRVFPQIQGPGAFMA